MSHDIKKLTKWLCTQLRQISLGICPVWSESLLSTSRNLGSSATHWIHNKDSNQTEQMPRLIWVFAGCTVTLLVLSWCSSNYLSFFWVANDCDWMIAQHDSKSSTRAILIKPFKQLLRKFWNPNKIKLFQIRGISTVTVSNFNMYLTNISTESKFLDIGKQCRLRLYAKHSIWSGSPQFTGRNFNMYLINPSLISS